MHEIKATERELEKILFTDIVCLTVKSDKEIQRQTELLSSFFSYAFSSRDEYIRISHLHEVAGLNCHLESFKKCFIVHGQEVLCEVSQLMEELLQIPTPRKDHFHQKYHVLLPYCSEQGGQQTETLGLGIFPEKSPLFFIAICKPIPFCHMENIY